MAYANNYRVAPDALWLLLVLRNGRHINMS